MKRREFLRNGTIAASSAAIAPNLLSSCTSQASTNIGENMNLTDYLNHFSVDQKIIQTLIAEGLSKGGDYCDVYFQHTITNQVGLEDDAVNKAYSDVSMGVGIRVLKGDQTGYSFSEELSLEAMKSAARTAANIANQSKKINPVEFKTPELPNYYSIQTPWEKVSIEDKIPYLKKINARVLELEKRIIKSQVSFSNSTSYILIANSEGILTYDYQPMGTIRTYITAEDNGKKESNGYGISERNSIELFDAATLEEIAQKTVDNTIRLFEAVKPKAGEMPVILAAGDSGILLHEAIGHGMEADFNRKGESIFSDKMGKNVAKEFVSIVDDGTTSHSRGAINVDDEGNPTECTKLVTNGVLTSYMHDRISAKHYGVKPTGNGRRESYKHVVVPRMRNTYMENGPHTKEEIIESVKYGIYAESFTNGQVNIGAGDFTFYVKTGYLVENGKITQPIKDINIIGNGPKVLEDIEMVGNDLQMSRGTWTCGKAGQGVPASMGQPTVKVGKITVGGING